MTCKIQLIQMKPSVSGINIYCESHHVTEEWISTFQSVTFGKAYFFNKQMKKFPFSVSD